MLEIPWVDKVKNEEAMQRIGSMPCLLKVMTKGRATWMNHILNASDYYIQYVRTL